MTPGMETCRSYDHHRLSGVRSNLSADIRRYLTMSPENIALGDSFFRRLSAFLRPELQCLMLHRIAHYLWVNRWQRSGRIITRLNMLLHKTYLSPQSCIGPGCRLPHPPGVTFHGRAGRGLTLFSTGICCASHPLPDGPVELGPYLGDRVTIGGHAVVIGPVRIGHDCIVSFSVCLDRDAPAGVTVVSRSSRTRIAKDPRVAGDPSDTGKHISISAEREEGIAE